MVGALCGYVLGLDGVQVRAQSPVSEPVRLTVIVTRFKAAGSHSNCLERLLAELRGHTQETIALPRKAARKIMPCPLLTA